MRTALERCGARFLVDYGFYSGGERGIRTLDRVSPIHAFQACAFNHSAISPILETARFGVENARSFVSISRHESCPAAARLHFGCGPRHTIERVKDSSISRRTWLAGTLAACAKRKATGYRGYCFVANRIGRSVAVIDLTRFQVRRQIPLDAEPASIAVHPKEAKVYVLAPDTGTVYEIDAASLSVHRQVRAGNGAVGMQVSTAGDSLWVLYHDPPALVELPFSGLQVRQSIRLPWTPHGFDLSRAVDRPPLAAVISRRSGAIALAALSPASLQKTGDASVEPSLVRFRSDGRQLLVGSEAGRSLNIFDSGSLQTVVRLPLPMAPRHFCFNDNQGQLFISGEGVDAVAIVYPYRTEVAETMLAGRAPGAMQTIANPALLLVANPQTDSVTVLDFDNMGKKLVAVVQVGQEPREILITPDQQYALVLNGKSGDVAVIRIYALTDTSPARRYKPTPLFTLIPAGEGPVSAAVLGFPART
jgi:DNA-binding beta-propeller fold protein YncE